MSKTKWENSCVTTMKHRSACGRVWHWDDAGGRWLDSDSCAKARREEVEHIQRHKVYTRVSREACFRNTGNAPVRKGWVETDKGQPGKAQHTREGGPRRTSHATTLPLEALKMVLSEIATGGRGRKVVALVDVRRAHFYAPSRRRVSKYHRRTLRWENVGCCSAACTVQGTSRRIGRRSLLRQSE